MDPPAKSTPNKENGIQLAIATEKLPPTTCTSEQGVVDGRLTLERLLALASEVNPTVGAARLRADNARGLLVQAGLYPNPILSWKGDDMNHPLNGAGKQGAVFQQNIVTGGKLKLDVAAAGFGVEAADWQAMTRWYDVVTRVRLAYFELLTAERELQTNEELLKIAEDGHSVATKFHVAGAGTKPDVIRAQVELESSRTPLIASRQRVAAARRLLAAAVGVSELPDAKASCSLEDRAPDFDYDHVRQVVLERSSEVLEARALAAQADRLVSRARVEIIPNIQLLFNPFHTFYNDHVEFQAQIGGNLPVWNHNQGNILAAQANLARMQIEVRGVELRLTERLAVAYQRYEVAREQDEVFRKQILPIATESLRLVRSGYEQGDPKYDYTTTLQAQRILAQSKLGSVQALGELWRAVAEIAGLLQLEHLPGEMGE